MHTSINSKRSGFKIHEVKLFINHESISVVANLSSTMSVAMNEYYYIAAGRHTTCSGHWFVCINQVWSYQSHIVVCDDQVISAVLALGEQPWYSNRITCPIVHHKVPKVTTLCQLTWWLVCFVMNVVEYCVVRLFEIMSVLHYTITWLHCWKVLNVKFAGYYFISISRLYKWLLI